MIAGHEVDFLWREARVIVETDAELTLLGFSVVRYAHDQVDGKAAAQVAALLAQRKPRLRNQ